MRRRRGSRKDRAGIADDVHPDVVVLTLSAEAADLLAASIAAGDADVANQLCDITSAIAASQAASALRASATQSRRQFLHGTWFGTAQVASVAAPQLATAHATARPAVSSAEETALHAQTAVTMAQAALPSAKAPSTGTAIGAATAPDQGLLPTARPDHTGMSPSDEAAAVVAEAEAIAEAAVNTAAVDTAHAAETARFIRAVATAVAAEVAAETAAQTADAIDAQAQLNASRVADAATRAASKVSASILPGGEIQAALTALEVATTVNTAAVAKAHETSRAASSVAQAVLAAAAAAASTASNTEQAIALEVVGAAVRARDVASLAARQLVVDATATKSLALPAR
ncbi:MAG: hypothetical protein H0U77_00350 [Nocardioidaceae bacterium]|nr:hypothetical protein [Nocardioidaceae bacterium]